jgi:hypothetical protein
MLEFMYKLDLPPLPDILTETAKQQLLVGKRDILYSQYHPADLLKPEWLTWEGIEWNFVNFFYKPNTTGIIHIDGPEVWGINWIHNGWGAMEYWLPEDVTVLEAEYDEIDSKRSECITTKSPIKVYNTMPGAYLTNAAIPHRASGRLERYAFSLRCYDTDITWKQAVAKFKHLML